MQFHIYQEKLENAKGVIRSREGQTTQWQSGNTLHRTLLSNTNPTKNNHVRCMEFKKSTNPHTLSHISFHTII
jgi:hypothetical protein